MQTITTRDLRESLTLLVSEKQDDGEGGWREIWRKGPQLWAHLWPLMGQDGFHNQSPGGPLACQEGYLNALPLPRYRTIIRATLNLPQKAKFLWHLRHQDKRLVLASSPVLVGYNRFFCMILVEECHG